MPSTLRLILAVAFSVTAAGAAGAQDARVDVLGKESVRGVRVAGITEDRVLWKNAAGEVQSADLDDLVSVSFAREESGPRDPDPSSVEVLLRDGDRVLGELAAGEPDRVAIDSPFLGALDWPVDAVREIRFLEAWAKAADRPVLAGEQPGLDLFYTRSLDHVQGTYARTTARGLVVARATGGEQTLALEDLLVVRFADWPVPPAPEARLGILTLVDGSRVTARELRSDGRTVSGTSLRGRKLSTDLANVVAISMRGGRFVYLPDLAPSAVEITPWLGDVYAWDRPRFDHSFLDRPIRAGGESWLKGIGVISGTRIAWALDGRFSQFTTLFALDDAAGEEGDVVFEVWVDGKLAHETGPVRRLAADGKPGQIGPIDVSGAREIALRVTWVDDFVMDFADWIEPMLIRSR